MTIATNMAGRGVDIKLGGELPEEKLSNINRLLAQAGVEDPYNMQMGERLSALRQVPRPIMAMQPRMWRISSAIWMKCTGCGNWADCM